MMHTKRPTHQHQHSRPAGSELRQNNTLTTIGVSARQHRGIDVLVADLYLAADWSMAPIESGATLQLRPILRRVPFCAKLNRSMRPAR
jgi:hypothetical protein